MSYSFDDDMLKKAFIIADKKYVDSLPEDQDINYQFSKRFENRMKNIIKQVNKYGSLRKRMSWYKKTVAIAASILIVFASSMNVSAVRRAVFEFISVIYEKYTEIFFTSPDTVYTGDFKVSLPSYIPEGYEEVTKDTDGFVYLEYTKGEDYILYEQNNLADVSVHINTENIVLEDTEFKGLPAKYYSNQGIQNLIWYDDRYMYSISTTLDREELYRIADSVQDTAK